MSAMSLLYLTPASIGYLAQLILVSAGAGYFWFLVGSSWQWEDEPLLTLLLAGAFSFFAAATLLLFLNTALRPDLTFYTMPLESIAVVLFLACLLQFAYRFPSLAPHQRREAQVVLGLTILDALWEGAIALHRYAMLTQGHVRYRPAVADFPLAAAFLWVGI
ncbi:MAG TPA: hypothetical protein DEP84_28830, partial [Chloroflexi bacterium]|nr:hypothetical protein [Chloroflexota bacterium]